MAIVSIATLKTYFETGDKPTEAQFVDLIDTLAALPESQLTTDELAAINGANSPSASNVFITANDIAAINGANYTTINKVDFDQLITDSELVKGTFYNVIGAYTSALFGVDFDLLLIADSVNTFKATDVTLTNYSGVIGDTDQTFSFFEITYLSYPADGSALVLTASMAQSYTGGIARGVIVNIDGAYQTCVNDDGTLISRANVKSLIGVNKLGYISSDDFTVFTPYNNEYYGVFDGTPTIGDDETKGYIADYSKWRDKNTQIEYLCTDPITGSAVWEAQSGEDTPVITLPGINGVTAFSIFDCFYSKNGNHVSLSIFADISYDFSIGNGTVSIDLTGIAALNFATAKAIITATLRINNDIGTYVSAAAAGVIDFTLRPPSGSPTLANSSQISIHINYLILS